MVRTKEELEAALLAKQTEEIDSKGFKKRLALLIPFNALVFVGTLKYCRNVHRISNRLIPKGMKTVSLKNLAIVATV